MANGIVQFPRARVSVEALRKVIDYFEAIDEIIGIADPYGSIDPKERLSRYRNRAVGLLAEEELRKLGEWPERKVPEPEPDWTIIDWLENCVRKAVA